MKKVPISEFLGRNARKFDEVYPVLPGGPRPRRRPRKEGERIALMLEVRRRVKSALQEGRLVRIHGRRYRLR